MVRTLVSNGLSIDRYIPSHLRKMFYGNPNPAHKYARRNGYDPYGFPTDNLVLHLPLWALKNAAFASVDAYQHTAVVTTADWFPDGREFNGAVDLITVPDAASLSALTPISVECWFLWNNTGAEEALVSKAGAAVREWNLTITAANRLAFVYWDGGIANYLFAQGTTLLNDGAWHHGVATWNGVNAVGNIVLYVDNAIEALTTDSKVLLGATAFDSAIDVEVGRQYGNNLYCFDGRIGEVRVYNRGFPAGDVDHNYNCTRWRWP